MTTPFFHCTSCDGYAWMPTYFNEFKHFVKCSCGTLMFLNRTGSPEEACIRTQVQVTLVSQKAVTK